MSSGEDLSARRDRLLAGFLDDDLAAGDERKLLAELRADPAFALDARALRRQDCVLETLFRLPEPRSFVERTLACVGYADRGAEFADRVWRRTREIEERPAKAAGLSHARLGRRFAWYAAAAGLLLAAGLSLHRFRPGSEGTVARIVSASPGARVVRDGRTLVPAAGMPLRIGDSLETGLGQSVEMAYRDEATFLELVESGGVRLDPAPRGKQILLKAGALRARVATQRRGETLLIVTAHVRAEVLGTDLSLSDEGDATRLAVHRGRVLLTDRQSGASVAVDGGFGARVGKGLPPVAKPLPPPGSAVAYAPGRVLFEDSFDRGLDHWTVLQAPPEPPDSKFQPAGDVAKQKVRTAEATRDGQPTACLLAELASGDDVRLGLRLRENIRSPAYAIEWDLQYGCAETISSLVCPGADPESVRSLYQTPAVPVVQPGQWFRQRAEFVPVPGAAGTNVMRLTAFLNDRLTRRMDLAFDRGAVALDLKRGRLLVDKVVVRELVPEWP